MIDFIKGLFPELFKETVRLEVGQKWTAYRMNPFDTIWIAEILDIKVGGDGITYIQYQPYQPSMKKRIRPTPGVVDEYQFRQSYPIFGEIEE